MRTIAQVPHSLMRITVTSWNDKYQLRFELDRYEQVFKLDHDGWDVPSIEQLALRMSDTVLHGFVSMRAGFNEHTKKKS